MGLYILALVQICHILVVFFFAALRENTAYLNE